MVTVTTADGQRVEGRLERIDDFLVTLITADGTPRTFRRSGAVPAVQINVARQQVNQLNAGGSS